jgi:hypothetical protein
MNLFRGFSITSLASLVILACAKEPEDDSFARRDRFVTDFCEIVSPCCDKTFATVVTLEECRANVFALDTAAIDDDKARVDCILQLQAASTKYAGAFCLTYGHADIPSCPDIRRVANKGNAKPGEPCTNANANECAPSFDGPVQCVNGACQVLKRGKEGDLPCTVTDEGNGIERNHGNVPGATAFVCFAKEDGLICDTNTRACAKPKPLDAECTKTEECVRTAYCNETTKTCRNKKSSDSACDDMSECQSPYHCEEGFCRHDVPEGESCKNNDMCRTNNCTGGKCGPPAPKDPRLEPVCKAAAPQG